MSAIDMIFTPMVAQSSDEASLTITGTFAVCGVEVVVLVVEPPELSDPPHADRSTAAMLSDNSRDELDIITHSLS
jgi:hypothetical protein